MDWKSLIFGLMGGLGVFLYGMFLMSESLQRVTGDRMKNILASLTKNRFMGVLSGALVTGVIQSSSATTVMTVGFVNAGIMTFTQAISVIMGANIGTTVTAQIIAFNIMDYAPVMIGVGAFMALFLSNKRWKLYGEALLGLGFLFLGLYLMSKGVKPLEKSDAVKQVFQNFSHNPFSAILAGIVITSILQSSSVTVGLVIVLAQQGLIDLDAAIPLILGDNIGTTIKSQLAALNASRAAKRTAMSHTLFNALGALIFLPFLYLGLYRKFIIHITPGDLNNLNHIGHFIANSHSVFNIISTIVFLCFLQVLVKVSTWVVPIKPEEGRASPKLLEKHLLNSPPIALQLVRKEMARMVEVAHQAMICGVKALLEDHTPSINEAHKLEDATDDFQHAITEYLIDLSERDLSPDESEQLPTLIHSVNDLERVGDHAENLAEISERMQLQKFKFSNQATDGILQLNRALDAMFPLLKKAVTENDPASALEALELEKEVNRIRRMLDNDHIERLKAGICPLPAASYFIDAIHNMEKIGDHLKNVAQTAYNFFTYSKGKASLKKIKEQRKTTETQPS
ncbi:Na/Pi cotransporter family protein [Candidatus Sumerlaeota bacterium]|nr:Na/Pi cotransporter family protein [Candidatus Sumerlaeota bacterium]